MSTMARVTKIVVRDEGAGQQETCKHKGETGGGGQSAPLQLKNDKNRQKKY